ncbi:SET domain-containing protein-lysine N-methyltransferase [Candidatus Kaiserbacteria bacterium RIFCSPHIGHO2_01_FULL_56_24]|uniref:SET domain-containing protein-lysine N-methyltransferase n=1 Tax=Candidatus Kaiserbacteria bacterium RIFCSPHIGHO2_01_FULL_56_24 TaxID=1798487 RepID=A0A1F6DGV3_9BACT|nr:MAG: SET domain-containing protein-lysine N-methyltransferase [Candidatus Kaiserbacteria bacterium RIFCSPHIGHO2_01_FULL_56_24]
MKKLPSLFQPKDFKLRVKRSRSGCGLFAGRIIPKGVCIIEYTGRPASKRQIEEDRGKYLFWTSSKTMIDGNIPSNAARFINHSCAPNCEIDIRDKRVFVFSKRRIKPGEELDYDYDTEYFERHIRPIGCTCAKCTSKAKIVMKHRTA